MTQEIPTKIPKPEDLFNRVDVMRRNTILDAIGRTMNDPEKLPIHCITEDETGYKYFVAKVTGQINNATRTAIFTAFEQAGWETTIEGNSHSTKDHFHIIAATDKYKTPWPKILENTPDEKFIKVELGPLPF